MFGLLDIDIDIYIYIILQLILYIPIYTKQIKLETQHYVSYFFLQNN